jgi:hypothetical protein
MRLPSGLPAPVFSSFKAAAPAAPAPLVRLFHHYYCRIRSKSGRPAVPPSMLGKMTP